MLGVSLTLVVLQACSVLQEETVQKYTGCARGCGMDVDKFLLTYPVMMVSGIISLCIC